MKVRGEGEDWLRLGVFASCSSTPKSCCCAPLGNVCRRPWQHPMRLWLRLTGLWRTLDKRRASDCEIHAAP